MKRAIWGAAAVLAVVALASCATTTGPATFGNWVWSRTFDGCFVNSGADSMNDAPWHGVACGGAGNRRVAVGLICTGGKLSAHLSPAVSGMVEYRFDRQPAVLELWEPREGGSVESDEAALAILAGLETAGRFRARVDNQTADIDLTAADSAAAVAAFLERCGPLPLGQRSRLSGGP